MCVCKADAGRLNLNPCSPCVLYSYCGGRKCEKHFTQFLGQCNRRGETKQEKDLPLPKWELNAQFCY